MFSLKEKHGKHRWLENIWFSISSPSETQKQVTLLCLSQLGRCLQVTVLYLSQLGRCLSTTRTHTGPSCIDLKFLHKGVGIFFFHCLLGLSLQKVLPSLGDTKVQQSQCKNCVCWGKHSDCAWQKSVFNNSVLNGICAMTQERGEYGGFANETANSCIPILPQMVDFSSFYPAVLK